MEFSSKSESASVNKALLGNMEALSSFHLERLIPLYQYAAKTFMFWIKSLRGLVSFLRAVWKVFTPLLRGVTWPESEFGKIDIAKR